MRTLAAILLLGIYISSSAQDSPPYKITEKFLNSVSAKYGKLEKKIAAKTAKALRSLKKDEQRIYKKLAKKDSIAAKQFLQNSQKEYQALEAKLVQTSNNAVDNKLKEYLPSFDTLKTSLKFLDQKFSPDNPLFKKLQQTKNITGQFERQMQIANEVKKQLKERKKLLTEQLQKFGLAKHLKSFSKEVYYYQEQLNEYKSIISDPKKVEQKALGLLRNNEAFKSFMKKNSMLASLFKLPDGNNESTAATFAGLQTRANVQTMLDQRFASEGVNPQQYMQGQLSQAQAELNKVKAKLQKLGNRSSDIEMPENFKPNTQKTKSFLKRLEYGANFQTQKINSYFPATTDVALSLGYKLNDKSVIGIGGSYKFGWGHGIEHIKLSHEGVGLRSYIDYKLKGSLWITGGYEQNYLQRFNDFRAINNISLWRQSALLGFSKKITIGKKKSSKVQLLYDFLCNKNHLRTQPLIFRIGYTFK